MRQATETAIAAAGGATQIARELGVERAAVSMWKMRGIVPAERVRDLERLCGRKVSRYELRPDVFGESEE